MPRARQHMARAALPLLSSHSRPYMLPASSSRINGSGVAIADAMGEMYLPYPYPSKIGEYRCLVVDPPWDQGKTGKRACRPNQGTGLDYPTLTPEQIKALPIEEWAAPESLLWLWATNSRSRSADRPILEVAFNILQKWGFRFYTLLTWDKRTGPCPFGPYQVTTEHVLFGYRGKANFPKEAMGKEKTLFQTADGPTASGRCARCGKEKTLFQTADGRRNAHSTKPVELYEDIRARFGGPRLDVFARRAHEGFDGWGNEYEGEQR